MALKRTNYPRWQDAVCETCGWAHGYNTNRDEVLLAAIDHAHQGHTVHMNEHRETVFAPKEKP